MNGRYVMVGGCVPNLMSRRFADAAGISYFPGAASVCNIEGLSATNMRWRTQPVQLVLARGTPGELVLDVHEGFTVMDGDEAAAMYDIILGRRALAHVSGFVVPFLRQFYYLPGLQAGDTTMYSLPIKVGFKRNVLRATDDAAAAFDRPYSFCVAGACLQDCDTPAASAATQSSYSSSSDPMPYLGHVVSADGMRPEDGKVAAIQGLPTPKIADQVRSFLGVIGFYRCYVPGYSQIAKPLNALLKKTAPFLWPAECDQVTHASSTPCLPQVWCSSARSQALSTQTGAPTALLLCSTRRGRMGKST